MQTSRFAGIPWDSARLLGMIWGQQPVGSWFLPGSPTSSEKPADLQGL
jgi:hypothetical protein